jgi:hypothetical protein
MWRTSCSRENEVRRNCEMKTARGTLECQPFGLGHRSSTDLPEMQHILLACQIRGLLQLDVVRIGTAERLRIVLVKS